MTKQDHGSGSWNWDQETSQDFCIIYRGFPQFFEVYKDGLGYEGVDE